MFFIASRTVHGHDRPGHFRLRDLDPWQLRRRLFPIVSFRAFRYWEGVAESRYSNSAYGMCFFDIIVYIAWKAWKRTRFVKPEEVDFSDVEIFDNYEAEYLAQDSLKKKSLAKRISDSIFN